MSNLFTRTESRARLLLGLALIFFSSSLSLRADYTSWKASRFTTVELANPAISGDDQDPDGDGVKNLLEYAFASDPKTYESGILPLIQTAADHLTLTHRLVPAQTDLVYGFESSDSLFGWVLHNDPLILESTDQGAYFLRTLQDPEEISASTKRFLRLGVFLDPDLDGLLKLGPQKLYSDGIIPVKLEFRDRSNTEAGFLIQKKEGIAGAWEELAILGADISSFTDALAENLHEYYYRVAALFEIAPETYEASAWSNELQVAPQVALKPESLLVSWVSVYGVQLQWEAWDTSASSYRIERWDPDNGWVTVTTLSASELQYLNEGLLPGTEYQYRVVALGATGQILAIGTQSAAGATHPDLSGDPNGDYDEDGLGNVEELALGTDPENPDTDGDEVVDGADWGPLTDLITKPRLPLAHYAVIELETDQPEQTIDESFAFRINNNNEIIGVIEYSLGTRSFLWNPAGGTQLFDEGVYAGDINNNGQLVIVRDGIPYWLTEFGGDQESFRYFDWYSEDVYYFGDPDPWDEGEIIGEGDFSGENLQIDDDGNVLADSGLGAAYSFLLRRNDVSYQYLGDGEGSAIAWVDILSPTGSAVGSERTEYDMNYMYFFPAYGGDPVTIQGSQDYWPGMINAENTIIAFDYENSSPALFIQDINGAFQKYDFQSHDRPLLNFPPGWLPVNIGMNTKLQIVADSTLLQNDQVYDLNTLVDSSKWESIDARDINENGIIVGSAKKIIDENGDPISENAQRRHAVMLVPIEFVTKGPEGEFLQQNFTYNSVSSPVIHVTTSSAQLNSNGSISLQLAGEVTDDTSDCTPTASKQIQNMTMSGAGVDQTFNLSNSDSPDANKPWRPYAFKTNFSRTVTLSDLQVGSHRIILETGLNAGGIAGMAEVAVEVSEPGIVSEMQVAMPAALSSSQIETLSATYGADSVQLIETQAASSVFVGSLGNFTITVDFNSYSGTTSGLDSFPAELRFSMAQKVVSHRLVFDETGASSSQFTAEFPANLNVVVLGLQISLDLPASFSSSQADEVSLTYGTNSTATLTETGNNTLIFEGATSMGTVRVSLAGFAGLTAQADSLVATWNIVLSDGWCSNFHAIMVESTATSRSFNHTLREVSTAVTGASGPGNFFPTIVRFPAGVSMFESPDMKVNIMDRDWSLKKKTYNGEEYWYVVDDNEKPVVFNPSVYAQTDIQTKPITGNLFEIEIRKNGTALVKVDLPVVSGLIVDGTESIEDILGTRVSHYSGADEEKIFLIGSKKVKIYQPDTGFDHIGESLEAEILWRYIGTEETIFRFSSRDELEKDLIFRRKIVEAAQEAKFRYDVIPKFRAEFWFEHGNSRNSASAAVADIFDPTYGAEYSMACADALRACVARAASQAVGAFQFDAVVGGFPLVNSRQYTVGYEQPNGGQNSHANNAKWIPGDTGYISNSTPIILDGAIVGENILYLGGCFKKDISSFLLEGYFYGHNNGIKRQNLQDWIDAVDMFDSQIDSNARIEALRGSFSLP